MKLPKCVFIGSALNQLSKDVFEEYNKLIVSIADMVKETLNCDVRYALEDSDPMLPDYSIEKRPSECYRMDRELVEECDLFIAEASFPSTGLGQELQVAEYNNKPVMLIYRHWGDNDACKKDYETRNGEIHSIELGNKVVSVMVQGNPAVIKEIEYNSTSDCLEAIKNQLQKIYRLK